MLPWCHGLRSILDFHWSFPVDGAGIGRREGSFGVRTSGGARRPRRGYSPHHIVFVLRLQFSSRHTILSPLRPPAVQGLHGDASVPRERGATEATTMMIDRDDILRLEAGWIKAIVGRWWRIRGFRGMKGGYWNTHEWRNDYEAAYLSLELEFSAQPNAACRLHFMKNGEGIHG